MKKRIFSVVLVICMLAGMLAGCGGKETVTYDYDYDLSEYITIGEYKGGEYKVDFKVKEGDTASIDYVGIFDGEEFEGGTGSYDLVIGSNSFIPGFEDGLIGYTAGDEVKLELTFPDPYPNAPDKAGKDVIFNVTINKINGSESMEEVAQEMIWEKYYEGCEVISYPEKEFQGMKDEQYDYYKSYATAYNMTFTKFLEQMDMTEEEFDENVTEYAEKMVAQDMALYALAREAGIEASEEALEKAKQDLFEAYGVEDEKEFEKETGVKMKDEAVQDSIEMSALLNSVLDYLVEVNTIVEGPADDAADDAEDDADAETEE